MQKPYQKKEPKTKKKQKHSSLNCIGCEHGFEFEAPSTTLETSVYVHVCLIFSTQNEKKKMVPVLAV